jgi:hypothetical protein
MNARSYSRFSVLTYHNKTIFILLSVIISFLIVDTMLIKIYPFTTIQAVLVPRLIIFIVIGIVYAIGQYIILKYVRQQSMRILSVEKLHLDKIHTVVAISQFAITAILILLILQMTFTSRYNNNMIVICTTLSYLMSIFLMGMLSKQFFSWYKSSNNTVVIFYAISSALIALNAGFTLILVDIILLQQPTEVRPHAGLVAPTVSLFFNSTSLSSLLNQAYIITTIASFISFWISTALLLRHYSERLGSAQYWVLLCIPLFFFMSQFMPLFAELFSDFRQSEPIVFSMIYTIIFVFSKPAGGILFGIALWMVARSLPRDNVARNYLIISAFGIVLLFTSNQAMVLVSFTYPPFGIVTISFLGLSSYLVLVGIYSSAISVAQDVNLRKSIKNHTLREVKMLDSIGAAQMHQEIENKIISFTKKTRDLMTEETGISPSISNEDIKKYIQEVLIEVDKKKVDHNK